MHEALHLAAIQLLILIHLVLQENGKRNVSYSIEQCDIYNAVKI